MRLVMMKPVKMEVMKRAIKAVRGTLRMLVEIFDDWLTRAAGIVCVLIVAIVIYNMRSELSETFPVLGALVYAMVPVLFIAGGVIFVMAILRFSRPDDNDETPQVGNDNEPS